MVASAVLVGLWGVRLGLCGLSAREGLRVASAEELVEAGRVAAEEGRVGEAVVRFDEAWSSPGFVDT